MNEVNRKKQPTFCLLYRILGDTKDFQVYQSNKLLRRGIEKELEIIDEATNRILKIDPSIEISDSQRIVDLRNWVIHGYDKVDDVIIWGILSRDLPKLQDQVEILIKESVKLMVYF